MRYMKIRIHASYIVDMCTQDNRFNVLCIKGLPSGSEFVYSIPDTMMGIWLVVSNDEFPMLSEGDIIPEFEPPVMERVK